LNYARSTLVLSIVRAARGRKTGRGHKTEGQPGCAKLPVH